MLWVLERALGITVAPPDDGVARYAMARPIAGHVDVLYLDDDMRVGRGNRGSVTVVRRAQPPSRELKK